MPRPTWPDFRKLRPRENVEHLPTIAYDAENNEFILVKPALPPVDRRLDDKPLQDDRKAVLMTDARRVLSGDIT